MRRAAGRARLVGERDVRRSVPAAGFAPAVAQTAPDGLTCIALVAAGVGVHVTTDTAMVQIELDGVRAVELGGEIPPILVHGTWRRDDRDVALTTVMRTVDELLPSQS
jgi:DNA-binding transcriptional LysR family regulator